MSAIQKVVESNEPNKESLSIVITMKATLGQRCAAAWPVTRGAAVSDLSGTWTTQWYLREPERDLVCTYLANVLLPFDTTSSALLHHVCNSTYWSETNKLSSYSDGQ